MATQTKAPSIFEKFIPISQRKPDTSSINSSSPSSSSSTPSVLQQPMATGSGTESEEESTPSPKPPETQKEMTRATTTTTTTTTTATTTKPKKPIPVITTSVTSPSSLRASNGTEVFLDTEQVLTPMSAASPASTSSPPIPTGPLDRTRSPRPHTPQPQTPPPHPLASHQPHPTITTSLAGGAVLRTLHPATIGLTQSHHPHHSSTLSHTSHGSKTVHHHTQHSLSAHGHSSHGSHHSYHDSRLSHSSHSHHGHSNGGFHHFPNVLARSDSCIVAEEEKGHPASAHQLERHYDDEMYIFSDEELSRGSDYGLQRAGSLEHHPLKRKRKAFTKDEDEKIVEGHEKFGNEWDSIVEWGHLDRTASQIRDRYRRITKNNAKKQKVEEKEPKQGESKLKRVDSHHSLSHSSFSDHSNDHHLNGEEHGDPFHREKERLGQLERELQKREKDLKNRDDEFKKREEELKRHEHEFQESKESTEHREQEYHAKVERLLCELLTKNAEMVNAEIRQNILQNNIRIGRLTYETHGTGVREVWQPGADVVNCDRRLNEIARLKEDIEKERKQLKKRFPKPLKDTSDEYHELSEIISIRLQHLKKEETDLLESRERLNIQRNIHIRETKRVADEDKSRFNNHPLLENRYLLLQLLGKGGFSEVYKAYDLRELREVACKIHQLNTQWSEQKKRNYSKHVVREYNIHKSLIHPRVVRLYDVFEIDENSFCTVLEYCDGGDLDIYLKNHPILSEREAKSIVYQIFHGLKYLNEQKRPVIHYDLKPGNILFHNGEIKITDFGLSKFYEEDSDGTELTSQGAGTYWYQPPECFETGEEHPKISSKVDVWAAGVIFYQMLYGRKPFGNGMSQQKFFSDHTLASAPALEFPSKPAISDLAKQFIRSCLIFQQKERPDVLTLVNDEYFTQKKKDHS